MKTAKLYFKSKNILLVLPLVGVLSGCGGGGGGGSSSQTAPAPATPALKVVQDFFVTAGAASRSFVTSFDEAAAAAVRSSPEFKAQDRLVVLNNSIYDVFSYAAIRAEYPLSAGLSGNGQTIAIVDDGFRLSHAELDGKTISQSGTFNAENHGTAVAAIAAGKQDGAGMMGVAPKANLHLSTFLNGMGEIAIATQDARTAGAVVQNNSWGYSIPITDLQAKLADNPGWSVERALHDVVGEPLVDVTAYLASLRDFTKAGVVVFAAPNEKSAGSSLMDGLPLVVPELGQGWLVGVSAVPTFDDDAIVSAERLSARCGQMAHTCLTATGIVYSATGSGDTDYQFWSGTSFAAPQIAAGVAILAEAFDGLPASDLRRRLLASANNGYYSHTGITDFGNGVVHGFNEEFGHGFMDLRAALLPIGATGLPKTNSVQDGVVPLGSTFVTASTAQGDAVMQALTDETVTIFDSLGAGFKSPALALYGATEENTLALRFARFAARNSGQPAAASFALTPGESAAGRDFGWSFHAGDAGAVLHGLGLTATASPLTAAPGHLSGFAADPISFGMRRANGASAVSFYSFSSVRPERDEAQTAFAQFATTDSRPLATGAGIAVSRQLGGTQFSIGASFLSERNSMLGMHDVGLEGSEHGFAGAMDFAVATPLPFAGTKLAVSAHLGTGSGTGVGLMSGMSNATFSSFGLSVERDSAFRKGDSLSLFARQPMRMESGQAQLRVPEARTAQGDVLWRELAVDLVPSARQVDLGFEYATPLRTGEQLRIGASVSHNDGHVRGASGVSLLGAFQRAF